MSVRSCSAAVALIAAVVLASVPAAAQTTAAEPPPRLEASGELAFVGNAGNASTSTFGFGGDLVRRTDGWTMKQRASFVRNSSEGALTAEALLYAGRTEHALGSGRLAAFGEYGFFRDRFAGVAHRHDATAGLTWRVAAREDHQLALDAGAGYLGEARLTGDDVSSASYSSGAAWRWRLPTGTELSDEMRVTGTFHRAADWRLVQHAAVTAQITSVLAVKVANTVRFAHAPAPGFKRTDTTTSIALVAKFRRPGP